MPGSRNWRFCHDDPRRALNPPFYDQNFQQYGWSAQENFWMDPSPASQMWPPPPPPPPQHMQEAVGRGLPGFEPFPPRFPNPAIHFHPRKKNNGNQPAQEHINSLERRQRHPPPKLGRVSSTTHHFLSQSQASHSQLSHSQSGLSQACHSQAIISQESLSQASYSHASHSQPKSFPENAPVPPPLLNPADILLTRKIKATLAANRIKSKQAQEIQNKTVDELNNLNNTASVPNNFPISGSRTKIYFNADTLLQDDGSIHNHIDQSKTKKQMVGALNGSGAAEGDSESSTSAQLCKEQILKTIMAMDKRKRRELIEQPRSSISRYLLDHLVHENQTAKARQLSTLRFRINTSEHSLYNELEMASTSETHIDLTAFPNEFSDEFLEQVKEFLKEKDDSSSTLEDDDIEVLAPPFKEPPPCIDLDLDTGSPSPSPQDIAPDADPLKLLPQSDQSQDTPNIQPLPKPIQVDNGTQTLVATQPRLMLNLFLDEKVIVDEIADINQSIEKLLAERKACTARLMIIKQKQFEALNSELPSQPQIADCNSADAEMSAVVQLPNAGLHESDARSRTTELNPKASSQMISLMHRLEENGIRVAISGLDITQTSPPESITGAATSQTSTPGSSSEVVTSQKSAPGSSSGLVTSQKSKRGSNSGLASSQKSISGSSSEAVSSQKSTPGSNSVAVTPQKSISGTSSGAVSSQKSTPGTNSGAVGSRKSIPGPSSSSSTKVSAVSSADTTVLKRKQPCTNDQNNPTPHKKISQEPTWNRLPTVTASATPSTSDITNVGDLHYLDGHTTAVRCMFSIGPCLFTASEDATVHVYDLSSGVLSMRVLGHQQQVTCLYSIARKMTSKQLKALTSTPQYLHHLNLITGSKDGYVRQFSLADGNLLHEKPCQHPITCMVASKPLACIFIGTETGIIYSYLLKDNSISLAPFKGDSEIVCLKLATISNMKAIIVGKRKSPPTIHNIRTGRLIMSLTVPDAPYSPVTCITTNSELVYVCDSSNKVCVFDTKNKKPHTDTILVSSSVASCYHDGKRYLYLGCRDGLVRVYDCQSKSFIQPGIEGPKKKALVSMKFSNDKILFGNAAGEVAWRNRSKADSNSTS